MGEDEGFLVLPNITFAINQLTSQPPKELIEWRQLENTEII